MDMMFVPWLEKLLAITTFFTTCEVHPNDSKNECNKFCLDCNDNPLCGSCISSCHQDHRVIQTRKSSYNEVVNANEIYKHVDILSVQAYMINGFAVVYINKRPYNQPKRNKIGKTGYISDSHCKICKRNLMDPLYFCSLVCKFEYIKKAGGFFMSAKEMEEMKRLLENSIRESPPKEKAKKLRKQNLKRKVDEAGINDENEEYEDDDEEEENEKEQGGDKENMLSINHPSTSLRMPYSRRKGIPYRTLFF